MIRFWVNRLYIIYVTNCVTREEEESESLKGKQRDDGLTTKINVVPLLSHLFHVCLSLFRLLIYLIRREGRRGKEKREREEGTAVKSQDEMKINYLLLFARHA